MVSAQGDHQKELRIPELADSIRLLSELCVLINLLPGGMAFIFGGHPRFLGVSQAWGYRELNSHRRLNRESGLSQTPLLLELYCAPEVPGRW